MASYRSVSIQNWSSVSRWTVFGTLGCIAFGAVSTGLLLNDLDKDILWRAILTAMVLSGAMALPLFLYCGLRMRHLVIANTRLGRVARTDSLTACLNRGAFTAKVTDWLTDPETSGTGGLLMIDADNFKAINDLYGHDVGDEALTLIARSVRSVLRNGDIVGRMGGEEFGVFLPGVTQGQAELVAERIRAEVNLTPFFADGEQRTLSVSIGGAVFASRTSFSELFRIADQRLYSAKNAGRNRSDIAQAEDNPVILLKRRA